jgi:hypothetical protein
MSLRLGGFESVERDGEPLTMVDGGFESQRPLAGGTSETPARQRPLAGDIG